MSIDPALVAEKLVADSAFTDKAAELDALVNAYKVRHAPVPAPAHG